MTTEPWERQLDETPPAFKAFCVYRDMGAMRSQQKVGRELGKSRALISRWSAHHSWVIRTEAFDREEDRAWLTERRELLRKTAQRNARLAAAAMNRVAAKLASMTEKDLDANSMTRLLDVAVKVEQLALGGPTSHVTLTGRDGGPVETAEVLLTDEDRRARMEVMHRELSRRLTETP